MGDYGLSGRDLAGRVATRLGVEARGVERVVDELVAEITSAVAAGEKVNLRGFGVFEPRIGAAAMRRRPDTGVEVMVPARRTVAFLMSRSYRARLNTMKVDKP